MQVVLPYNIMVVSTGGFPEYLNAGDIVRGYHYNARKFVDFPITHIVELPPTRVVRLDLVKSKPMFYSGLTKVLTQGGSVECYKAPFLLGVCLTNPRQLTTFGVTGKDELHDEVKVYQIEWEDQNFFLWAEGILVGSLS